MRVLFCASEAVPYAKTGGLADVAGALPKALAQEKMEVMLVIPKYKSVGLIAEDKIPLGEDMVDVVAEDGVEGIEGVKVFFIRQDKFFLRDSLYGYPDDASRFIFFDKAILVLIKKMGWKPDIIHCNDWQTGLIPVFIKTIYKDDPFFKDVATLFTIHNLGYQGNFPFEVMRLASLPPELFTFDKLEFWGQFSFMKGGIVFSDMITTVSPRYAEEIQKPPFGAGMEGALAYRRERLQGILNGIDTEVWNPASDKFILYPYDASRLEVKGENKKYLQKEVGLPPLDVPLVGMVSRLASQKGFDILLAALDEILKEDVQFVVLGLGEKQIEEGLRAKGNQYPEKFKVFIKFDERLSHLIYAGCDIFLMPSLYEPCGLGQMIAMKYGTVPVVRKVGGLADTVEEFVPPDKGCGFLFEEYSSEALSKALYLALKVYKDEEAWRTLQKNCMKKDFSWRFSARQYIKCYEKAMRYRKEES